MNNLYISHRSLYTPTYSFEHSAACLSVVFKLLPGLILFAMVNFREKYLHKHELQLYNYPSTIWENIIAQMYKFLVEKIFIHFLLINFSRSNAKIENNSTNTGGGLVDSVI